MVKLDENNQWKLDRLDQAGLILSCVYGKSGGNKACWSVQVWSATKEIFDKPFAADSLVQCIDIAIKECEERGLLFCVKRLHG